MPADSGTDVRTDSAADVRADVPPADVQTDSPTADDIQDVQLDVPTNMDATDSPAPTDVTDSGTPPSDVMDGGGGDVSDSGNGTDAADVTGDTAPTNPFDPQHYYYEYPTMRVAVLHDEVSDPTSPFDQLSPHIVMRTLTTAAPPEIPTPTVAAGDCILQAVRTTGYDVRNSLDDFNFGTITFSQGTTDRIVSTYSGMPGRYSNDTAMATNWMVNTPTTITIAGGPSGNASGPTTLPFPPMLSQTGLVVPTLHAGSDNVFTWTVPPGLAPETATLVWGFDSNVANVVICVVPASRGRLVIPGAVLMPYVTNMDVIEMSVQFTRQTVVNVGTHMVDFRLEAGQYLGTLPVVM